MGRIFILGNKKEQWMDSLSNPIPVPSELSINDNNDIVSFIEDEFKNVKDGDKIVINLDTVNPKLALIIGLHIRFAYSSNKILAFLPILFVSYLPQSFYLHCGVGSQLLLSLKGIYFCQPDQVLKDVVEMTMLSESEYLHGFLNIINVKPDAKVGHHSIANEWGIFVLARLLNVVIPYEICLPHRNTLYFKYILCKYLIEGGNLNNKDNVCPIDGKGLRLLVIDDEIDKGLDSVIKGLLPKAKLDIPRVVTSYCALDNEIREYIKKGKYDIIFLDLRLNGSEEDVDNPSDFSGVKMLKEIKSANQGNQVIILTASNKAWNLRTLLEFGADGYYVKESPEYGFDIKNSIDNLENLIERIKYCKDRYYLRNIWRRKEILKKKLEDNTLLYNDEINDIINQLDAFYYLISNGNPQAENDYTFVYSYIALEQIYEIISSSLTYETGNELDPIGLDSECNKSCTDWYINGTEVRPTPWYKSKNRKNKGGKRNTVPVWKKICSIYYTLLSGSDYDFGYKIYNQVDLRNSFIHTDVNKDISKIFNPKSSIELFDSVEHLLYFIIEYNNL